MADYPILYSAPMINALLDGRKFQTRRLAWREAKIPAHFHDDPSDPTVPVPTIWQKIEPGDRLWARETWGTPAADSPLCKNGRKPQVGDRLVYRADPGDAAQWGPGLSSQGGFVWRPSIHMFRWASRLTLIVTEKRLERVQDISEEDAEAEGAFGVHDWDCPYQGDRPCDCGQTSSRQVFGRLWDSLHGDGAWSDNPEIVVMRFTVHKSNIDAMETADA